MCVRRVEIAFYAYLGVSCVTSVVLRDSPILYLAKRSEPNSFGGRNR